MRKTADKFTTEAYIRVKKCHEFKLANAIRDHFGKGQLRNELNELVYAALIKLPDMPGAEKVWNKNRAVLKVISAYNNSLADMTAAAKRGLMNPIHCGDVIRLYGEVAEEDKVSKNADKKRVEIQNIGGSQFWDKKKSPAILPQVDMTGPKVTVDPGTRVRLGTKENIGPVSASMQTKIAPFDNSFNPNKPRVVKFRGLEARSPGEMKQIGGGMVGWAPQDTDILYRIEIAFGLRVGATISGTTTDTLYFLNVFEHVIDLDPIFYLLPLATIVAPGHHSLIEAAMPLSIHERIAYSIGLYSTLLPIGAKHPAAGDILSTLTEFERHEDNRLLLVFFQQREVPAGCWEFEKGGAERTWFQDMAKADKNLMTKFKSMNKPYLTELDLDGWFRQARLRNAGAPFLV